MGYCIEVYEDEYYELFDWIYGVWDLRDYVCYKRIIYVFVWLGIGRNGGVEKNEDI